MNISYLQLHGFALCFRLVLVLYGEWQDRNFNLKFTDVDYHVFTDAAWYVSNGESPYLRSTYRYSPLLAWLLVPCYSLHILWGKLVFIAMDLVTAIMIQNMMQMQSTGTNEIKFAIALWLFNPVTMTISSRGNAESIMSALVIGTIYALYLKKTLLSGILFSFSVHMKIFPLIYGLPIYLFLGSGYVRCQSEIALKKMASNLVAFRFYELLKDLFCKQRLVFMSSSAISFAVLTLTCYLIYGFEFLRHAYFYHVTRKDIWHNFSVYFYMLYTNTDWWLGLVCFLNQAVIIIFMSLAFYKDLPFCCFLTTYSFVTFNKICTSQYFLWYLTLLPLLIPGLTLVDKREVMLILLLWGGAQTTWLSSAYSLEFKGDSVFFSVWMASLLFFAVNVGIIVWFIKKYKMNPTFLNTGRLNLTNKAEKHHSE